MKKLIPMIVIMLFAMGLYMTAPSRAEPRQVPQDSPAQLLLQSEGASYTSRLPGDDGDQIVPMVSCGIYQGTPCTGTSRPRCDLAPGEPAICFCVNGFYECS